MHAHTLSPPRHHRAVPRTALLGLPTSPLSVCVFVGAGVPAWADANRHNLCTIDDVAKGLSNRRRAAAHMYSERAVTGDSAKKHHTQLSNL